MGHPHGQTLILKLLSNEFIKIAREFCKTSALGEISIDLCRNSRPETRHGKLSIVKPETLTLYYRFLLVKRALDF